MTANPNRALSIWLYCCCGFIALMVFVGGVTRLTESGLSITEWKPVTGVVPPLSDSKWQEYFEKYKQIPEYQQINRGMSLDEFKFIYWWEFGHRFLGRITGFVLLLPWIYFAWKGYTNRSLNLKLLGIFCLGGMQGVIGWYMVKSGLSERTDVSQYRLAMHLTTAFLLFSFVFWLAMSLSRPSSFERRITNDERLGWLVIFILFIQIIMGALVAGLNAGMTYNTYPLMDGKWIPDGLFLLSPWYLNFFENITMVQFQHRWSAILLAVLVVAFWNQARRVPDAQSAANHMLYALILQITLGIKALIYVVPISLASAHQMGALLLLFCTLRVVFRIRQSV